jgi:SecD/SecF fusion protein
MAVDANVLINERLREERGREGSLSFALKKAYERAFRTILDSNLTTLIPAFVLLWPGLATEEVKGFAVVMIIGIGVSMFTAIVITRMIFETGIRWGWIKELRMLHLFQKPNLDWMRFARVAFVVTLAAAVVGVIVFLARGPDKYDIEFLGGTQVELALKVPEGQDKISIETVRKRADEALGGAATVQELEYATETGEARLNRFLISVPAVGAAVSGEAAVKAKLAEAFADLRPEGGGTKVQAAASDITEDVVRQRLQNVQPGKAPAAAPAAGAPAAAPAEEARSVRYIPPEERQYLGKIRIVVQVAPPVGLGEFQRRIDTLIRDRFPEMVGTLYRVEGAAPGDVPGEFKSFELWVRDDFGGKHADTPNPAFWTGVVELAMGQQEAFASTTSFEPTMAGEAWDKALIAILLSLTAMAVYIWLRFAKLSSGIAAVVATVHDVLITLGAVSLGAILSATVLGTVLDLTDMKVNLPLIGAFLTLVGYSVNDTIVVFDRIRENRGKYGDLSIPIVNNSINQTLSRTVLTSSTVFVAVVSLYFFGGKTSSIHGLAFVMLVGTVVGCYSSVAIASPILVMGNYLRRLYAWAYPIAGLGLLGYFIFVWPVPVEALGSWADGVRIALAVVAVAWAAWVALAWQAVHSYARGRPWAILVKSPPAARAIAAVSLAAPVLTVFLFAVMVLGARASGVAAWAGPAALAMLATCPATYFICKMARKTEEAR